MPKSKDDTGPLVYSSLARRFHWYTVAFVAIMIPLGVYMSKRGNEWNIWDATTNNLYSLHKGLGFTLLVMIIARLIYRFRNGAPADEPGLAGWQKLASHATHWSLYGLLILVPMLGWLGVSRYGALGIVGPLSLPGLVAQDQDKAAAIFWWHGAGALLLGALILMHIGAAMMHFVVFKDGVLGRMLPGLKKPKA